jgi:hypothetical protein
LHSDSTLTCVYDSEHGRFELSSIPATLHNLFNLSLFLSKRDEWAGSFDELLLDSPRDDSDSPMHLPDPPRPAVPWTPPPPKLNNLLEDEEEPRDPLPQHCGREDAVCRGSGRESVSQRRRMEWLAHRSGVAPPTDELTHAEAHAWLSAHWERLVLATRDHDDDDV